MKTLGKNLREFLAMVVSTEVVCPEQVGLPKGAAHIGEFDEDQCSVAIKACQEKWRDVYSNEVKK